MQTLAFFSKWKYLRPWFLFSLTQLPCVYTSHCLHIYKDLQKVMQLTFVEENLEEKSQLLILVNNLSYATLTQ